MIFVVAGLVFATWASRIPQVRDALALGPGALGLVLLAVAAGSVVALPLAGPVIGRVGTRRTVAAMSVLAAAGLAAAGLASTVGVAATVAALFAMGVGMGAWDVAMNVQAALVERRVERQIMARFHAGFSIGGVAGALLGALAIWLGVSVAAHLALVAAAVAAIVPLATRGYLPDVPPPAGGARRRTFDAWRERRTLLIGVFVLAISLAEGAGVDWLGLAMIDGHDAAAAVGTLGFAAYVAAMTAVRWAGPGLLDRYGRVRVVRVLAAVAIAGLALLAFGPGVPAALAGAVLWGAGMSLGFPIGMSAGADDPARAAARVSVVSSIGYCAFIGGPPLIGLLAEQLGILHALAVLILVLGLAAAVAGAVAPLAPGDDAPSR